jgi:hypothetical protein
MAQAKEQGIALAVITAAAQAIPNSQSREMPTEFAISNSLA